MNGLERHDLVIVQDENDVFLSGDPTYQQVVDQQRQHGLHRWRLKRVVQYLPDRAQVRIIGLQGGKQVREEACRFIVLWFEREPRDRDGTRGQPVGEQRGLAEANWRRNEDQGSLHALLEALDQAGTMHQVWTWSRDVEVGGKQRINRWMGERRPGLPISRAAALLPGWMAESLCDGRWYGSVAGERSKRRVAPWGRG